MGALRQIVSALLTWIIGALVWYFTFRQGLLILYFPPYSVSVAVGYNAYTNIHRRTDVTATLKEYEGIL